MEFFPCTGQPQVHKSDAVFCTLRVFKHRTKEKVRMRCSWDECLGYMKYSGSVYYTDYVEGTSIKNSSERESVGRTSSWEETSQKEDQNGKRPAQCQR